MWRRFCRHVVDVENEYIEKDGILEDAVQLLNRVRLMMIVMMMTKMRRV